MVEEERFRRVDAIRPHWSGVLLLSKTDNVAALEGHPGSGVYELTDTQLTIVWPGHAAADVFVEQAGLYIHQTMSSTLPDADRVSSVAIQGTPVKVNRLWVLVPDHDYLAGDRARGAELRRAGREYGGLRRAHSGASSRGLDT